VYIEGNQNQFTGSLIVNIRKIYNPIQAGTTDNIFIKIFDSLNNIVIEKSFNNLDPSLFTFAIPGP
jgi:hypothetical protein